MSLAPEVHTSQALRRCEAGVIGPRDQLVGVPVPRVGRERTVAVVPALARTIMVGLHDRVPGDSAGALVDPVVAAWLPRQATRHRRLMSPFQPSTHSEGAGSSFPREPGRAGLPCIPTDVEQGAAPTRITINACGVPVACLPCALG